MGEAKRRIRQVREIEEGWRQRVRAGEFGPQAGAGAPGAVSHVCVVFDKSQPGHDALLRLRGMPEFAPLQGELDAEAPALQMWRASSLFTYAVIYRHAGEPRAHTLLAADDAWLVRESLPRALRSAPGAPPVGLLWAVEEARRTPLQEAAERLRVR